MSSVFNRYKYRLATAKSSASRQVISRLISTSHYDVAIIGGGHNALVSACYLSKHNKKVCLLEKRPEFGGATQSVYAFPGVPAKLSRYSYLVALFPDQIKKDLRLEFETFSRSVSWYAPHEEGGVLLNRVFDEASRKSLEDFAGTSEVLAWERFYEKIGRVAEKLAPTLLEPLMSEEEVRCLIGEDAWTEFVEQPLSVTLDKYFTNDLIKGIVLTDGLIGTWTTAEDKLASICFLYHLIGNGTGEWRVPNGGMGALVGSLLCRAKELGVNLRSDSEVTRVELSDTGVHLVANGEEITSDILLSGASPAVLEKLTGIPPSTTCRDGCQIKVNMVLERLPRLNSGIDPKQAFAGTYHINESYDQLRKAFTQAESGEIPDEIPAEMYCHTLTDSSILDKPMVDAGNHTLTLFALHTPAFLFDKDHDERKAEVTKRIMNGLNQHLAEPIESLILKDSCGNPCLEVKTPQELEKEIGLPRGNIFHGDLSWPWRGDKDQRRWGAETSHARVFVAGAGALRGGGVSGIAGHNAAMATLERLKRER
jgi:phytoene dehydrogenase-like protein